MTVKELYDQVRDGVIISDIELQREIVYNTEKQELVIDSIVNDIPLPAFYLWKKNNGILEVLDGKQRIHAITRFFENDLEYNGILWKKTKPDIQQKICNTSLAIIICEGEEEKKEKYLIESTHLAFHFLHLKSLMVFIMVNIFVDLLDL